jgi:signal transduction histidine kinase
MPNNFRVILIAEDSPTQSENLRYFLERHGYQVVAAKNGREALDLMARHKPHLLISDIVMPEMDGYELCHCIRSDQELRDLPIIFLSVLSDPRDIMKSLECGADSFLIKPFKEEPLIERIRLLLNSQALRKHERAEPVEVVFHGKKYLVNADRLQIMNLLVSTYEAAVETNLELLETQRELKAKSDALQTQNQELKNLAGELDFERARIKDLNEELADHVRQLEVANKELKSFSYSVSHDLRAPLRGIAGFAKILQEDYGDKLDSQGLEYLQMLHKASEQMNELISALLVLSRVSQTEMRRQVVDLSGLVRAIVENLKSSAPDRQVEFAIADGLTASGDPTLLRMMLENLLGNAWKFTGKNPQARIEFGAQNSAAGRTFFISDNGVGFDMKYADKLFGAFQRLHATNEFPGTGIGLATVQRVINRHGGRIWTEGEVDKGATFYFTLGSPTIGGKG